MLNEKAVNLLEQVIKNMDKNILLSSFSVFTTFLKGVSEIDSCNKRFLLVNIRTSKNNKTERGLDPPSVITYIAMLTYRLKIK